MHKVLVLDADQRSALAIIRSLGRRGLNVTAGHHQSSALGAASKYASATVRYPDPAISARSFVSEIAALADRLAIDTVIPATDSTTMLLVSQPDPSKFMRLAAPTTSSYEALTDKARLFELADRLGIPAPVTRIADTATSIEAAAHEIGFPIVLKPARSRYLKGDRILSTTVQIATDPAALTQALRTQGWVSDVPCLVQRFVSGHGAGIFALHGPAGPIAWFAHRRIREKPPTGGVSVLCESVPVDPIMQSIASRLLAATGWVGVAMIEFRVADDGTPYLMEVNGRFWGSLQLAIDCGLDFPWLLYQVTHGLSVTEPQAYTVGRRLRWLMGDLDSLLISLQHAQLSRPVKARALGAFMRSFLDPTCRQEVLRTSDPLPGVVEVVEWVKALRAG